MTVLVKALFSWNECGYQHFEHIVSNFSIFFQYREILPNTIYMPNFKSIGSFKQKLQSGGKGRICLSSSHICTGFLMFSYTSGVKIFIRVTSLCFFKDCNIQLFWSHLSGFVLAGKLHIPCTILAGYLLHFHHIFYCDSLCLYNFDSMINFALGPVHMNPGQLTTPG